MCLIAHAVLMVGSVGAAHTMPCYHGQGAKWRSVASILQHTCAHKCMKSVRVGFICAMRCVDMVSLWVCLVDVHTGVQIQCLRKQATIRIEIHALIFRASWLGPLLLS